MKKLVVDRSKCNACGACTLEEIRILQEDSSGIVEVIGSGIIADSEVDKINEIISLCPTSALSLLEDSTDNKQRLEDLKAKMLTPLTFDMPSKDEYAFRLEDKNEFAKELTCSTNVSGAYEFDYKSSSSARSAGERAFRDEIYSQYEAIGQQVMAMYEQRRLNKVARYAEIDTNYKYNVHKRLISELKSYVNEIEACTGKNLQLSSDFFIFRTKDTDYIIDMQESHNSCVAERIRKNMKPASDFYSCVKIDESSDYVKVSKWFGDDEYKWVKKYSFWINSEKLQRFFDAVARAAWNAGKYTSQFCETELNRFHRDIENEWKDKISYLMRQI